MPGCLSSVPVVCRIARRPDENVHDPRRPGEAVASVGPNPRTSLVGLPKNAARGISGTCPASNSVADATPPQHRGELM